MNAEITVTDDILDAVCSGRLSRQDVVKLIDTISMNREKHPLIAKCILDLSAADVNMGIMGEFIVGEYAAKKLGGMRISLIRKAGQIDQLLEDTAYNRGLRILMVEGRAEA